MAKDLVVIDVVDLPANQLPVSFHVPSTKAAHTRLVADLWVPFMPSQIPRPVMNAEHVVVETTINVENAKTCPQSV